MTVAYENPRYLVPTSCGSGGVGESLGSIVRDLQDLVNSYKLTISGQRFDSARKSLFEISRECSEINWDGYGAKPITSETYFEALGFIDLLPEDLEPPDIVPEPTGKIGLEWRKGTKTIYVIALGGKNLISYAGIFGPGNETHGTENFAEFIPETIIEHLNRL